MRAANAIKLTVQQRLGFEISLARRRIEEAYERMQKDLHEHGKYTETSGIQLHESEQILAALERVSGEFYRRHLADMKAGREEEKRRREEEARETAESVLAPMRTGHRGEPQQQREPK